MALGKKKKARRRRKSRFHRGVVTSVKGGECHYRSGWELRYITYLDAELDVISFQHEPIKIEYVSNARTGRKRKYIPDFVVQYVDRIEVVEIKQLRRVNDPKVIKKTLAARDWCVANNATFKIVTEIELKALGLL